MRGSKGVFLLVLKMKRTTIAIFLICFNYTSNW